MILKEDVKEVNDGSSDDSQDYLDLLPVHRHELDKNVKKVCIKPSFINLFFISAKTTRLWENKMSDILEDSPREQFY